MGTPHKHAAVIKAWADGAQIEVYSELLNQWCIADMPSWLSGRNYRVKPEPKPDIVRYAKASFCDYLSQEDGKAGTLTWWSKKKAGVDNIKATFDGETGKLKKVEIV